ncbi:MAG: RnfABCDGE type electron transport complex subunit D [Ruminococcus sp.]|nr:RnfABCDGE type electron transport complex subunit D [Ruminococcus sp.]MCM1381525.1 RnfABCDGE type electron transport complex subunit D [Muribaculaceae bacterium]MCM1479229.1 RnfABCDGE type electron transport complex subunit D [Muribaculaceae bacterium]
MSTTKIMLAVIIALVPAAAAGCVFFGPRAAGVLALCIACSIIFEALFNVVTKRKQTVGDLSAIVTGLLLGMNLPATVPFYIPIIGSFVAIVIVKQLFGGIGQNFANPAIAARIVLMLSFSGQMSNWVKPYWYTSVVDAETSATPLAASWLDYTANGTAYKMSPFTLGEMFFGETGGCIGETCAAALIAGGLFLMIARVISPATPVAYIGSFALFTLIATGSLVETAYGVLAGGLLIGAFFMATDYATTPVTTKGKIIFGIGCGFITFIIRTFGSYPEGVSFSILLMNLLTPYIDRLTRLTPLGAKTVKNGGTK